MDRQVTGQRTFDYNKEGVAHYGLYADWLADLRRTGGQQMAREMNRGAEAYLQMWERAEGVKADHLPQRRPPRSPRGGCSGACRWAAHAYDLLRRAGQPSVAARRLLPLVRQAQQGRRDRGVQQPLPRRPGDHDRPAPPLGPGAPGLALAGAARAGQEGRRAACTWAGA